MELLPELLKQGVVGLVAAIGFYLYFQEQKERKEYQNKYEASLEARRIDSKETTEQVTVPMQGISQGIKLLTDKIVLGKKDS